MKYAKLVTLAAAAPTLMLAACSHDQATGTDATQPPLDLTAIFSEMTTAAPGSLRGAPATSIAFWPPSITPIIPSECTYSDAVGGFVCPTIAVIGMSVHRTFFLYDASGAPKSKPDAATTASVRTVTDISGTLPPPPVPGFSSTTTLARHEDMTLSGLLVGRHVLNGSETSKLQTALSGNGLTQTTVIDEVGRTTDLVLPAAADGGSTWPRSGQVALNQTIVTTRNGGSPITDIVREVMTFDGTSIVTVAITRNGVTTICKFDLTGPSGNAACVPA